LILRGVMLISASSAMAEGANEEIDPGLVLQKVGVGVLRDFGIRPTGAWAFLWPIVIAFAFGIGISGERYYTIIVKSKVNMHLFTDQLVKFVESKDYDRAIALCDASPAGALPILSKAGLEAAKRNMGGRAVQDSIDEETLKIMPQITKRLSWVSVLANIATLMGLMGTIFGLMYTFAGLELVVNPKEKAAHLSTGIATAMNTTLIGLVAAVPLTLLAQYLGQASKALVDDIDENSVRLINALSKA
jgi:biopolymer transport protein ExbB